MVDYLISRHPYQLRVGFLPSSCSLSGVVFEEETFHLRMIIIPLEHDKSVSCSDALLLG